MDTIQLEYYDRATGYHGIGTFVQLNDRPIKKGDRLIVPPARLLEGKSTSNRENWQGCCEGREKHSAYLKPLLLTCKGESTNHISTGYGAYRKDLCYVELD